MYLVIDNSGEKQIKIAVSDDQGEWRTDEVERPESGGVLSAIVDLLAKSGRVLSEITGLAVVIGKGRFTQTRVAAVVANVLGFTNKIPTIALVDFDLAKAYLTLKSAKAGEYIMPKYSANAHIGGVQAK